VSAFRAVLFDWRGTLFHDEPDADWILHSAASIGLNLASHEVDRMVAATDRAGADPRVVASRQRSDCSAELNRAAGRLLLEEVAGLPAELADAIWQRDGDFGATVPYVDTAPVLKALKGRGHRIAIVSDIHYDLRPTFQHHGLHEYVDAYVLSYEHGMQKPDPRLFATALHALSVAPEEALMVGDRASRDAGGLELGIATLLLPTSRDTERGLNIVLGLVDRA
jgi:FMN phosphatase YigB (HAD superfamily)